MKKDTVCSFPAEWSGHTNIRKEKETISGKTVQLNEEAIKGRIKELVRGSVMAARIHAGLRRECECDIIDNRFMSQIWIGVNEFGAKPEDELG